jgi:hypothetical protein
MLASSRTTDLFERRNPAYPPLGGAATLVADGSEFELRPGTMVRVGPDQLRQIHPGPEGIQFVAIGGAPGAFTVPFSEKFAHRLDATALTVLRSTRRYRNAPE